VSEDDVFVVRIIASAMDLDGVLEAD
jgi:hypothetical protein